jgi:Spy/CpxP family protein refolding chaperone
MIRKLLSLALVAGSLASVACGGNASTADKTETAASPAEQRVPFLDVALNADIGLRPEQRTSLEALRATIAAKQQAVRGEGKTLANMLADALEKGSLDKAAADAQVAKIAVASDAVRPDIQAAIGKVHALLDPAQREAVAAAMREHKGKHGGFGGKGQLFAVMKDLDLTSEQKDALKAVWHAQHEKGGDHQAKKAAFHAALDGFAKPDFDVKSLPEHHKNPATFAERGVAMVEAAIPILDQAQRQKLAAAIRTKFN